ncbi:hypothetical protein H257_07626 [Aphanomyces astaci]|uniref:HAT C-terminal dimerisation domain-containing protein n=1 Tax=Aphanomyces astaci TaxID=112090 RepID=W4GHM7_APHAT|nr:hypothetical protein H257_07626 [Aphanomyces astaci]ETV78796.1 hypothetical protein H257_07626 [Aphanomyces astaci]|eukprot:XP_009831515.1 hypothetical protein H257_07626 [Aphanomyces astaci]
MTWLCSSLSFFSVSIHASFLYPERCIQNGTGYTNLTSYIEREHPEYQNYDATAPISEHNLFMPLFSHSVRNVYGWLAWITSSLLRFKFCENDMARRYSNIGPIRNKTLMKWMHQMCRWLEAKLKNTLPKSFAMSMAARGLNRRKLLQARSNYLDCHFLRPTSNVCERLFSVTKWAMTDRHRSVLPSNLEEQLLIHCNSFLWGSEDSRASWRVKLMSRV